MERNPVGWFEIPVEDMDRATGFYEKVLGYELERHEMGPLDMAWFPMHEEAPGATGSLVHSEKHYKPSTDGVLIYFSSPSGDLDNELGKVEDAGGKVIEPKTKIGEKAEHGHMALIIDTEGNRVALHSRK